MPVKNWVVGCWHGYSVWGKVQICIWPSWCHCHSLSLAPVNPDWFYLPGFTFLVPAHRGSSGHRPGGHKTVILVPNCIIRAVCEHLRSKFSMICKTLYRCALCRLYLLSISGVMVNFCCGTLPVPFLLPSLSIPLLRCRPPLIQLGCLGSAVSTPAPSRVWGRVPPQTYLQAFLHPKTTSGDTQVFVLLTASLSIRRA